MSACQAGKSYHINIFLDSSLDDLIPARRATTEAVPQDTISLALPLAVALDHVEVRSIAAEVRLESDSNLKQRAWRGSISR